MEETALHPEAADPAQEEQPLSLEIPEGVQPGQAGGEAAATADDPGADDGTDPDTESEMEETSLSGQNKLPPRGTVSETSYEERSHTSRFVSRQMQTLSRQLSDLCEESDPEFVLIGRKLTMVTHDVKKLTDTVHKAVSLLRDEQENSASLTRIESLIQDVFSSLSRGKDVIHQEVNEVKRLVKHIFKCDRFKEMIDRINTLFRIVRINIRIQCSAQALTDELFEGVSDDLDYLSKKLHKITKQILKEIKQGAKSLTKLQDTIISHMQSIDEVIQEANPIVSKAFYDINQLMNGAKTMIRESDSISGNVSEKVSEVVVGIQFHDSLSQRVNHIIHAFNDVGSLCENNETIITDMNLGAANLIIDLQHRQLNQLCKEIKLVRERIESDFLAIESEVMKMGSILHDAQFREVGPKQFLGALFSSIDDTLVRLNALNEKGEVMVKQIHSAATDTMSIAKDLLTLKEDISEIREETRVQAVNTIIMASSLGRKGKTIEVLAKEIQNLSDKSGILADDVEAMQLAVEQSVNELLQKSVVDNKRLVGETLPAEIKAIKNSFNEIIAVASSLTLQIDQTAKLIKEIHGNLSFLNRLEARLDSALAGLRETRARLSPWAGKASHDAAEIEQLVKRYSMEKERMIHMFDRVEESQGETDDDTIFF